MSKRRTYQVGNSTLRLEFGDLTHSQAQVLVSSDDYYLSMGGGVSRSILWAGGDAIAHDAAKMVPATVGDVVVTTAGKLSARYIFHVVTLGANGMTSSLERQSTIVERATDRCIELLGSLRQSSIAFPAIGTGAAGFSLEDAAVGMAKVINEKLRRQPSPVEVSIYLFDRFHDKSAMDYARFFEEFSHRTPELPAATIPSAPSAQRMRQADHRIRLFYSYSHKDERWREQLEVQLAMLRREGLIESWHDRKIGAGDEWKQAIDLHLDTAEVVLLLVGPDFLASDYCYDVEMTRALENHRAGTSRVVPIILHDVDWKHAPFAHLQVLPRDGKPITSWANRHSAWKNVAEGIRKVVHRLGTESRS